MRPPLDLQLPRLRRWPPFALAVSVALHVILLIFGVIGGWLPRLARMRYAPLPSPDTVAIVLMEPRLPLTRPVRVPAEPRRIAGQPLVDPFATVKPRRTLALRAPVVAIDTPPDTMTRPAIGQIKPELGEGKLWVRPLPLPPQELAKRLTKSHAELADSAVTAVVQAYLDSIANEPGSRGARLPEWTTRVAGKKFGIDSSNIYIAGLKIPAAVLALLPIPAGNIDQSHAYNRMMDLRADIQNAAQRAANLEEFKARIKEIRLRKEREEEFERNQRTPPERPAPDTTRKMVAQP